MACVLPHRRDALLGIALLAAAPALAKTAAEPLTVFAATSLQDVLEEVGANYRARTGQAVRFSFAASSTLARQIEQGAPADAYISADLAWMDYLDERGLLAPGTRVSLLSNRLALIAPTTMRTRLRIGPGFPLAEALGDGRLAVADPDSVPAGRYARAALTSLGVWPSLERRLARAENVRAALALVARGEAPFGIVYETDARAERRVVIVGLFPANTHAPIVYPGAVTAASTHPAARGFLAALRSRNARSIFVRAGFRPL